MSALVFSVQNGARAEDAAAPSAPVFELSASAAAPTRLNLQGNDVPLLPSKGGFELEDFKTKHNEDLQDGQIAKDGDVLKFSAKGQDLSVSATFTPGPDGTIQVSGAVESLKAEDRPVIVRYLLPVPREDAVFQNDLSRTTKISASSKALGTIFPIATVTGPDWGVALAIPPTYPCCFGMTGTADGLSVEFYLGLSPKTKNFPNQAAFRFFIDSADPAWGFRSALAQYYQHFPEFYQPRFDGSGFWDWNDPAQIDQPHSVVDDAMAFYKVHGTPHTASFFQQVDRDNRDQVLTFDYQIVGMRELTKLPTLPANYDAAMDIYHKFAAQWRAEDETGPLHKQYVNPNRRNTDLPDLIDRCVVQNADGHDRLIARSSPWGANSITFTMNPNPDLFKDQGVATIGSTTLQVIADWFEHEKSAGVHMDSLGYQWPACLNYREDHFPYARYPLTFDKNGRLGLHNRTSHYEFLEDLRALARKDNKLIFGNGIDIYENDTMEEHYQSLNNGRFFLAAQIDAAGREIEDDVPDRERLDAFRTCLGPKLMTEVLYKWKDREQVELEMNRALVYDIFAAPNRWFGDKVSYLDAADGYARDKDLLAWFSKNARMLHDAGWQPVTYARVNSPEVVLERYGTGDNIYFALDNLGTAPVDCQLDVDLKPLHLSPKSGKMSSFTEVANNTEIKASTEDDTGHVRLKLVPDKAAIIKLARAW